MPVVHRGCAIFTGSDIERGRRLRVENSRPNRAHEQWLSRLWSACLYRAKAAGAEKLPDRRPKSMKDWPADVAFHIPRAVYKVGPEPEQRVMPGGEGPGFVWLPRYTPGVPSVELSEALWADPFDTQGEEDRLVLRDYQAEAVDAWWDAGGNGVLVVPTGGGKTPIGIVCASRAPVACLILVPSVELWRQWRESLARWTRGVEIGFAGNGEEEGVGTARVVVAITATVMAWDRMERKKRLERFGLVIVDESRSVPAEVTAEVIAACPGPFRLGLDATPYRSDGLTDWIFWTLGPVRYEIAQSTLEEEGHVARPVVLMPRTGWDLPPGLDGKPWTDIIRALVEDEERNWLLADILAREVNEGRTVMAVTDSIPHTQQVADAVAARLGENGCGLVGVVTGKTAKGRRGQTMDAARDGVVRCLIGTVGKQGFDCPAIDTVVLLMPQNHRKRAAVLQAAGRALRPVPGKEARLIDPLDDWGPFKGWARGRVSVYRKTGWSVER